MNHTNETNSNQSRTESNEVHTVEIYQVLWLLGLAVSCVCILMQIILFAIVKICRKTDEKILTQMTFARIMVTLCEYWIMYNSAYTSMFWKDIIHVVYFYVDFSLVVWMFVFSKNLYIKIVIVYPRQKMGLLLTSILVWTLSLPFGLVAIFLLKLSNFKYFFLYYKIYACIKFVIVTLNAFIYFRIFYVAFKKGGKSRRNISDVLKTALMAFLLVIATCLQVFVTDVLSLFNFKVPVKIFCVINAFHAVLITIIFIIILRAKMRQSLEKTATVTLNELEN